MEEQTPQVPLDQNTGQVTTPIQVKPPKKKRFLFLGTLLIFLTFVTYSLATYEPETNKTTKAQKEFVLSELTKRYNESFVVENSDYYWNEGGTKEMNYLIHPSSNQEKKFLATLSLSKKRDDKGEIYDSYNIVKSEDLYGKDMEMLIKGFIPNSSIYFIHSESSLLFNIAILDNDIYKITDYEEKYKTYKEKFSSGIQGFLDQLKVKNPDSKLNAIDIYNTNGWNKIEGRLRYPGLQLDKKYETLYKDINISKVGFGFSLINTFEDSPRVYEMH